MKDACSIASSPSWARKELTTTGTIWEEVFSLAREVALDRSTTETPDDQYRIAVATSKGALPDLDRDLSLDLRDPKVKKFACCATALVHQSPLVGSFCSSSLKRR
jgi:hypothetical protein